MSQFHLFPGHPCHHTLNKGSLSPTYSPTPVPPLRVSVPRLVHIFAYPPRTSSQEHIIALISCRSPFLDINTSILEDRPKGPYILVLLTSLMSSFDQLTGALSTSRDGCVSRARL